MSLFLAGYLPRAQSMAQVFKEYGVTGLAPCPVSQSQAFAVPFKISVGIASRIGNFASYVSALLIKKDASVQLPVAGFRLSDGPSSFFAPPPLSVTFPSNRLGENVTNSMENLSFTKQTAGIRQVYYKGSASDSAVKQVLGMGADSEGYSPFGCVNIAGFLCWSITMRVINAALLALTTITTNGILTEKGIEYAKLKTENVFLKQLSETKGKKGIYIPYFHGLNTVDKAIGIDFIIKNAYSALGASPKEIVTTCQTVSTGWHSLSATPEGMVLAHLMRCVELGIQLGKKVLVLNFNEGYHGCIIEGDGILIMRGKEKFSTVEVYEHISRHHAHDQNLAEIAEILSALDNSDDKKETIMPAMITNPRVLHNYIRARKIDAQTKEAIRKLVKGLHFSTEVWDISDADKTALAIEHIVKSRFLPPDFPMAYKTDALYTKDHVFSTLAAFGLRAPSLVGLGSNLIIPITKGDFFKATPKNVSFKGVPIFYKPIQQAYEDWKDLMAKGVLSYKSAGNGKDGATRLPGVNAFCDFESNAAKRIRNALSENVSQSAKEEKRKRDREEQREGDGDSAETAKRARLQRVMEKDAGLAVLLGGGDPTKEMDADTEDNFDF